MENKKSLSRRIFHTIAFLLSLVVILNILVIAFSFIINRNEKNNTEKPTSAPIQNVTCIRSTPYEMTPEFQRGISIIKQKMIPEGFLDNFENCLDIQYDQLKEKGDGPEGVFMFDSSVSSPNDLIVLVDNSYKSEDDYMTAVLLVHEITHAKQFYEKSALSCVDREVHAFWNELLLLTKLNDGEKHSITSRLYNPIRQDLSDPLQGLDNLIETAKIPYLGKCKEDPSCTQDETVKLLKKQIEESPYYQKQCEIN